MSAKRDLSPESSASPRTLGSILQAAAAIAIAASALLLTGCFEQEETQTASFPETKLECLSTAVPNSFVIEWTDGSRTVARGWTREEFTREVFEPMQDEIRFVEQDQRVQLHPFTQVESTEAQDHFQAQWSPEQYGQLLVGADQVWAQGVRGSGVLVAVVDSGMDRTHPMLAPRLYTNAREVASNGIDDDQNGYIDDVQGYNFFAESGVFGDASGHGTHVGGIIAADHSQNGIAGMAPAAQLLPLGFMSPEGSGSIGDAVLAIEYAAQQGAKVINASWGGAPCSTSLQKMIRDAGEKGVLFIAAAGNSGISLDNYPEYPAAFSLANQLTVGASTSRDYTAGFSNYSYNFVNLFAPGSNINSTYPGARTAILSGTSMAAPFVSGAAALLFSDRPRATPQQIRQALLAGVDQGGFAATSRGRLNVRKSLDEIRRLVAP